MEIRKATIILVRCTNVVQTTCKLFFYKKELALIDGATYQENKEREIEYLNQCNQPPLPSVRCWADADAAQPKKGNKR